MFMMNVGDMQLEGETGQYRLALKNKKSVLSRNPTSTILLIINLRLKKSLSLIFGEVAHVDIYHSIHVAVEVSSVLPLYGF